MNPVDIKSIANRHLDAWFAADPATDSRGLRDHVEAAISEALAKQADQFQHGTDILRHERDQALGAAHQESRRLDFLLNWNSTGHPFKARADIDAVINAHDYRA